MSTPHDIGYAAGHADGTREGRQERAELLMNLHTVREREAREAQKGEERLKSVEAHWDALLCNAEARARQMEAEGFKRGWDAHAAQTAEPAAPWLDAVRACPGDVAQACAHVYQSAYLTERMQHEPRSPYAAREMAELSVRSFRASLEAKS